MNSSTSTTTNPLHLSLPCFQSIDLLLTRQIRYVKECSLPCFPEICNRSQGSRSGLPRASKRRTLVGYDTTEPCVRAWCYQVSHGV